jgi:hypothetical protein
LFFPRNEWTAWPGGRRLLGEIFVPRNEGGPNSPSRWFEEEESIFKVAEKILNIKNTQYQDGAAKV